LYEIMAYLPNERNMVDHAAVNPLAG
jgi:hypothetical protein